MSSEPTRFRIDDAELVKQVVQGTPDSWQRFLDRYADLIFSVVKRHLPAETEDDVRGVYVDVLGSLYRGGLGKYRSVGSLPAWLAVCARRRAVDYLREKYGRIRPPRGRERLSPIERDVFDLFYVERLSIEVVVSVLAWKHRDVDSSAVIDAIDRIEAVIDPRFLKRLDTDAAARAQGSTSTRTVEWVNQLRWEYEHRARESAPDREMMLRETLDAAARVRKRLAALPRTDREVVRMRYEGRMTAREISHKMRLGGQRRVYTILDRVLRVLRRASSADPRIEVDDASSD